jgi:hypothetical protein
MNDITSIVARVAMLSIQAGRVADDLQNLMRDELDHARRGVLHRVAGACREFSLHSDHALIRLAETARHSAAQKLAEVRDALKIVSVDAAADDPNKAALEAAIDRVGAVRKAVPAM